MEELMDLLVKDESPSQISDKVKDILYSKSAEKIETIRPQVATSLFDEPEVSDGSEETFDNESTLDGEEE
jgi:hypothetical protein